MIRAIDVSVHQGAIDWRAVKTSGVAAAWIRVGGADGGLYRDLHATANLEGAEGAGLPFGTYYFGFPSAANAVNQARHAVGCGLGAGTLPPALDLEAANGLSGMQLDEWALAFCAEVERQIHRTPMIYTGRWVGAESTGYFGADPRLARFPLWIANYGRANVTGTTPPADFSPSLPPAWRSAGWSVWQFNSVTWTPGITANTCDQDVITEGFWAAINDVPQEWHMRRILIQGDPAQYRLVDDAHGVLRRQHVDSLELVAILDGSGVTDGEIVLTDPAQIARFRAIPETGTVTAEIGLINVVANGVASLQSQLAQIPTGTDVDVGALGTAIADHIAEHMRE